MRHAWIVVVLVAACGKKADDAKPGTPTCAPGEAVACAQIGYKWTGESCCFDLPPNTKMNCVAGEPVACAQIGAHWTGKVCCVEGPLTCTDGEAVACAQSGSLWTGAKCCVK